MNVQVEGTKRSVSLIYAAGVQCFECRESLVYIVLSVEKVVLMKGLWLVDSGDQHIHIEVWC